MCRLASVSVCKCEGDGHALSGRARRVPTHSALPQIRAAPEVRDAGGTARVAHPDVNGRRRQFPGCWLRFEREGTQPVKRFVPRSPGVKSCRERGLKEPRGCLRTTNSTEPVE